MFNIEGFYLCLESKADGKLLYFLNNDIMEEYMKDKESEYEFLGMQFLENESELIKEFGDEEKVALMKARQKKITLMKQLGLDVSKLKEHEIDGYDNPDETEEEIKERKSDHRKKNLEVVEIDEHGQIVATGDSVDEFIEEREEETRPFVEKTEETVKKYLDEKGFVYQSENTGNKVSDIEERIQEYGKQYVEAGNSVVELQERINEEIDKLREEIKNKEADESEDLQKVNNRKMAAFAIEDLKKRYKEEGIRLPVLKGLYRRYEILTKLMDKYIKKSSKVSSEEDLVKELWDKYKSN